MTAEVLRTVASIGLMTRLGEERGVPAERLLHGTELAPQDLTTTRAIISRAQELTVIDNLVTALGDPPLLGLDLGSRFHLTTHGIWGFALVSSPTLRDAITVALRYLDLTFPFCRIVLHEDDDEACLVVDASGAPAHLRHVLLQRDVAAIRNMQHEIGGTAPSVRFIELPVGIADASGAMGGVTEAADPQAISRLIDVEVRAITGPVARLVFDRAGLDLPLPQADPVTATEAQAQCTALLDARRALTGHAAQVREAIAARISSSPDIGTIATVLGLSRRTLQRRLTSEQTSYRTLVEEVRQALARELLEGGLPVALVARQLGFTEVSSFSQAFRRWEGMSPTAYRHHRA